MKFKWSSALLCMLTAMVFSSCSKKDKEYEQNPNNRILLSKGWDTVRVSRWFSDISFGDPSVGYLLGAPIQKTTDGGRTWAPTKSQPPHIGGHNLFFLNASLGWIAFGNTIQKTTDGGNTWEAFNLTFFPDGLYRIQFLNEMVGYCVTKTGLIKSTDGGETWALLYNGDPSSPSTGLYFLDAQTGWAADKFSIHRIVNGVDAGKTELGDFIHAIHFFDQNTGIAVIYGGKLFRTSDGGKTWQEDINLNIKNVFDMHFFDKDNGYVTGNDGVVKVSGKQVQKVVDIKDKSATLYEMHFFNEKRGIVVDWSGLLFRYSAPN